MTRDDHRSSSHRLPGPVPASLAAGIARKRQGVAMRQLRLLNFVEDFARREGVQPTVREIARGIGVSSTAVIAKDLAALAAEGALIVNAGVARTTRLPGQRFVVPGDRVRIRLANNHIVEGDLMEVLE